MRADTHTHTGTYMDASAPFAPAHTSKHAFRAFLFMLRDFFCATTVKAKFHDPHACARPGEFFLRKLMAKEKVEAAPKQHPVSFGVHREVSFTNCTHSSLFWL